MTKATDMDTSIDLTDAMIATIDRIKKLAEDGDEGDISFVEISSFPLVSLSIRTGSRRSDTSQKKRLHFEYKMQPSSYPSYNIVHVGPEKIGYDKYKSLNKNLENNLSFKDYGHTFNSVCEDIDRSIRKYHGIKCYEDGNVTNGTTTNVVILHVCDVMNIIISQQSGRVPPVFLKTGLFKELKTSATYEFLDTYFTIKNREFLLEHVDFFYLCYGYFGNHSFVPIRTLVFEDSNVFKDSKFLTNDNTFVNHQMGKLKSFNQNNDKVISKMVYRSI